jgi:predicted Zn-dependent protease
MLEKLRDEISSVVNEYPHLKIQLYLAEWQTDFLRFYKSQTNYNISKHSIYIDVYLYKDNKNYTFSINNPTAEAVKEKIEEALTIIDKLPPDPDFVDLESDLRKGAESSKENNIVKLPLEKKVEILKRFKEAVTPYDFDIYGTFICNYTTSYIINSNGVNKKMEVSPFYLEIKAVSNKNEVTVLERTGGENVEKMDVSAMINSLVNNVQTAQNEVIDVDAGEYEVILAPGCIGDLMSYFSWSSLNAFTIDRKNTILEGRIGEQIFPDFFTLHDSPKHPDVVNIEYSSDGFLVDSLPIFEKGVFKNFLVGNYYANKLKMTENGNSGDCMVMATGNVNLEQMIKSVKKGLYISSFHYINFINSRETSLTGLTRDGTFLIEDGKLTKVVNNLRFTDKITNVINKITEIEDRTYIVPGSDNYWNFAIYAQSMPHVKVQGFNISSSTRTV